MQTRSGGPDDKCKLWKDEIWEVYQQNYGYGYQEAPWNWMCRKHYTVRLSLFRFSERTLQLGDLHCTVQTRWGGHDDQSQIWTHEVWKVHQENIWRRDYGTYGYWLCWRYYKVRLLNSGLVREYCNWETFKAQCNKPGEVILMKSAHYGRMKYGRCILKSMDIDTKKHHEIGCSENIIK